MWRRQQIVMTVRPNLFLNDNNIAMEATKQTMNEGMRTTTSTRTRAAKAQENEYWNV